MIALVYHRVDNDGRCSAAIVRRYLKRHGIKDVEMFPYNYGEPLNDALLSTRFNGLIIVDFSFLPAEMLALRGHYKQCFTWIDHHGMALDNAEKCEYSGIRGSRRTGIGACLLTWQHYFASEVPLGVKALAEYDVWKLTAVNRRYNAIAALQPDPASTFWDSVFVDEEFTRLVTLGTYIVERNDVEAKAAIANSRTVLKKGIKMCVVNHPNATLLSEAGFSGIKPDADVLCVFNLTKHGWGIHFREVAPLIHCGELARECSIEDGAERPGGGHPGAGSYKVKQLPEWLIK